jgi:small subunit ribosomal protein S4
MVYRMGFADSRAQARQLVNHGHFLVNGRKVSIPSFQTKPGMTIELVEKSRAMAAIEESLKTVSRRGIPPWLDVDSASYKGVVKALPSREELPRTIHEQLIVEFYSR